MNIGKKRLLIFAMIIFIALLFSYGCNRKQTDSKMTYTVSIIPQKFLLEKIGGDKINVNLLVKPGSSPAVYTPDTSQILALGRSKAFFTIGVAFEEQFLKRIINEMKNLKIVPTYKNIKRYQIEDHHHEGDEGHEEENTNNNQSNSDMNFPDPHIWMDPLNAIEISKVFKTILIQDDPENKEYYEKNYDNLEKELKNLDKYIHEKLDKHAGKSFFIYHPSLGYFAREYNLNQIAFEIGGKEPSSAQIVEMINEANEHEIKVIFVQPEFSKVSAEKIANAIKGKVIEVFPLSYDYINNLKNLADAIDKGMSRKD